MRLTKLALTNFGVYQGENEVSFGTEKPVVLIGGMNGRGKTTLLEAVLAALYGANSVAFEESGYSTFGQYLRAHTNVNAGQTDAAISLSFLHEREGNVEELTVERSWDISGKHVRIETIVLKNGQADAFLTENWAAYVEDILPRALSNFFFFDGEKIAELALDGSDGQIRDSIRRLLGVSTVDVLRKDLKTVARRIAKKASKIVPENDLDFLGVRVDDLKRRIQQIDYELEASAANIQTLEKTIERLRTEYASAGGDAISQRTRQEERQKNTIARLSELDLEAISFSAGNVPFAMFAAELPNLLLKAKGEYQNKVLREAMGRLEESLEQYDGDVESVRMFFDHVHKSFGDPAGECCLGADTNDVALLSALVKEIPKYREEYSAILTKRATLQRELEEIDNYLSVSVDETAIHKISSSIECATGALAHARTEAAALESERARVNGEYIRLNAEYKRATRSYIASLDDLEEDQRVLRYISVAEEIFESYSVNIQKNKTAILAAEITSCYKRLANKKTLISQVSMDPETLMISYFGVDNQIIDRELLSAGEKQLMVIATLWALAKCSGVKLPVIIDTPLARLDSAHRLSIVREYFPNASEQTIILSTDSEIFGQYYKELRPNISDEYTLEYDEKTRSTKIKQGYFEGGAQ